MFPLSALRGLSTPLPDNVALSSATHFDKSLVAQARLDHKTGLSFAPHGQAAHSLATAETSLFGRMSAATASIPAAGNQEPVSAFARQKPNSDFSSLETDFTLHRPVTPFNPQAMRLEPNQIGLAKSLDDKAGLPTMQDQLAIRDRHKQAAGANANVRTVLSSEMNDYKRQNPAFSAADAALSEDVNRLHDNGQVEGDDTFSHELFALHDSAHALNTDHNSDVHPSTVLTALLEARGQQANGTPLSQRAATNLMIDYIAYRSLKSSLS